MKKVFFIPILLVLLASCSRPIMVTQQKFIYHKGAFYPAGERQPLELKQDSAVVLIFSSREIKLLHK